VGVVGVVKFLWREFPHASGFVLGWLAMYAMLFVLVLSWRLMLGPYPT